RLSSDEFKDALEVLGAEERDFYPAAIAAGAADPHLRTQHALELLLQHALVGLARLFARLCSRRRLLRPFHMRLDVADAPLLVCRLTGDIGDAAVVLQAEQRACMACTELPVAE